MGLFSRRSSAINYGEVNIATPAKHIIHISTEQSFGTNVLKGYDSGALSFGEKSNLFNMVDMEGNYTGLQVQSWGYQSPFGGLPSDRLYIRCYGWIFFEIELSETKLWESWLSHYHPKPSR